MAAEEAGAKPRGRSQSLLVLAVAVQNAVFVAAGLGLWLWSGRDLAGFIAFSGEELLVGLALGGALTLLAAALFCGFPRASERLVRLQADTYAALGPKLSWGAIVAISLAAGIGEEALLRGGLQTLLGEYSGPVGAILLSSAVFASIHLSRPVITALLFVIGIVFGFVYWLTGSLLAVMVGHALYDVWALRYLHREMRRLGLLENGEPPSPALANPGDGG